MITRKRLVDFQALNDGGRPVEKLQKIDPPVATVSKNFKINLEGQNYVHFYVILSRNVKIFGIMASL